ncbi:hypothetical protein ANCCEY_13542 [Ancylostoma ceylanicum]|uniref:Uncharacterized protein n=1 Tax=Ancylostoma ceylanicum TaxID=53326 RepID=A0A0D6L6T1_9BILA|nr:hypothetical protein ANCCEY_13542 [Ancylostoma ceylanicum]
MLERSGSERCYIITVYIPDERWGNSGVSEDGEDLIALGEMQKDVIPISDTTETFIESERPNSSLQQLMQYDNEIPQRNVMCVSDAPRYTSSKEMLDLYIRNLSKSDLRKLLAPVRDGLLTENSVLHMNTQ